MTVSDLQSNGGCCGCKSSNMRMYLDAQRTSIRSLGGGGWALSCGAMGVRGGVEFYCKRIGVAVVQWQRCNGRGHGVDCLGSL